MSSEERRERRIGLYVLLDALAPSDTATVHLAKHIDADGSSRVVVLRRVVGPPGTAAEIYANVALDAASVTRVRHPSLVSTLEVLAEDRELFFVSEYVPGETLARLL